MKEDIPEMEKEMKNAIIKATTLGYEDHGILTCLLHLDYGGTGQAFGGYGLDEWNQSRQKRIGSAYGMQFIAAILETVGVRTWEELRGKHIRVLADRSRVYTIGHIIEDKWFGPEDLLK